MIESRRVPLPGSERAAVADARATHPVAAEERFEVTVRVRRKTPIAELAPHVAGVGDAVPQRRYLSRAEYASHAVNPADFALVERFAREHGLVVVATSAARRSVFLSGTARQYEEAFGTCIRQYECDAEVYRGRTGPLTLPEDVAAVVEGVFGIDDRQAAIAHFQRAREPVAAIMARASPTSFTPPQLARLYEFPKGDGAGECIGIIELGGGFRAADITRYFGELGLAVPKVVAVRVDGARNAPSNAESADGEVMLDIEVAAAVAPRATLAVYFAPNSDKGFIDALTMAIHDETHKPSAISISWGNPEKNWTPQALNSMDQAFQTAAALGVTICCAAGDAGSGDENPDGLAQAGAAPDGRAHADFPASSPHALACGGTRLVAIGSSIGAETVWNDDPLRSATGGGVSDVFPLPAYQANANVPPSVNVGKHRGRGLPDVCAVADPQTGYRVRVDGQEFTIGGTSAVAPLWAGLVALLNQQLGHPVGFLNPMLYGPKGGAKVCRDITAGNNGAYSARAGWDACTGWGSPNGTRLLQALKG